ncbi:MAG: hypothetical protein ACK5LP_07215 [Campylobacteraceae bacterium]
MIVYIVMIGSPSGESIEGNAFLDKEKAEKKAKELEVIDDSNRYIYYCVRTVIVQER